MGPKRARVGTSTRQQGESSSRQRAQADTPARQSAPSFDRHRFVSAEASRWHSTSLLSRNHLAERAIQFIGPQYEEFEEELARRSWHFMAASPAPSHPRLVEEFYANLRYSTGDRILVRGRRLNISHTAINRFCEVPEEDNDTCTQMIDGEVDWSAVLETIAHPGSHWTYHTEAATKPRHLENRFLSRDARIWLQVIISRLMPVSHTHTVTTERCILLHCLLMGESINLGKIIRRHMQKVANTSAALAFPSLITAMALQAGVQVPDDEDVDFCADPLNNVSLAYTLRRAPPPPQVPQDHDQQEEEEAPPEPEPALEPEAAAPEPQAAAPEPPRFNTQPIWHELRGLRSEMERMRIVQIQDRNRHNQQFWAMSQQLTSVATDMRTLENIMRMSAPPELRDQLPRLPPMPPAEDDDA